MTKIIKFFLPITIIAWVFHFAILLYLINRDEIPWLVIIFLMPVIEPFVFMLLSSNDTSRKEYERFKRTADDMKKCQQQTEAIERIKKRDSEAYTQANYLTPYIPDKKTVFFMTRLNYRVLIEDGVKIYEYTSGFIHAKNYICDDKFAVCGTINMDYRSLIHHFECGAWLYDSECIPDMKEDFLNTIAVSEEITLENAKLKGIKRLLAEVMKVFSPLL